MSVSTFKRGAAAIVLAAAVGAPVLGAAAEGKSVAYVTNQDGGVVIVDLETLAVKGTINVEAKEPRGIGVTADGKYVITANKDGGDVSVIDTAANKVIKHIAIGKNPEFVRVYGDFAYVSFEPSSGGKPEAQQGADKDGDDDKDKTPAQIAIIDLKDWKVVRSITSGPETEGIEFSRDGKLILVTNEGDNTITVYELASGKPVKTIETKTFGERPRGIKVSPDGQIYVVTLEYGDKFLVLDRDLKPVKTVPTGKTPYGVAFDRAGKRLFVATSRSKELQVFDAKTFEPIKKIPVGDRCWHFSFTPDDAKILVACGKSNELLVIDANSYATVKKISDLKLPWGVVTYPKAMGSLDAP
jgi:YVTN family beta-propeller protein